VRYILPVYPLLAITTAIGVAHLFSLRSKIVLSITLSLLITQVSTTVLSTPDHLAYFNVLAGTEPERMLVDSDLDWGQDISRAANELQAREVSRISATLNTYANLSRHGFPHYEKLMPGRRTHGWILISLTKLAFQTSEYPNNGFCWLKQFKPVATIGKSILLFHLSRADAELSREC
jgi:hypothetical protein